MNRRERWSRIFMAIALPFLMLGMIVGSTRSVTAVGCGDAPLLGAPAVQSQERWRYTFDGAGSYELVDWSPTEAVLLVNSPGCALSRIALVGLDLIGGGERWRVTYDQWQGEADRAAGNSDLVVLPTSQAVYAFDETSGAVRWTYPHTFEWIPQIVSITGDLVVLETGTSVTALSLATGTVAWQNMLPVSSVSDWSAQDGAPLVALGRPANAGEDVQAFGIDPASGMILWQTPVGSTISSTGGTLWLTSNRSGLVVAEVITDGTSALVAFDAATGTIRWSTPLSSSESYSRTFVTDGAQPVVIHATGGSLDVKTATAYDAVTGMQHWQNENIGADAILVDGTHLVGAGPTLSYMNALVLVDGESGEMVWSQYEALVDGRFPGTAQIAIGELVFTPSMQEVPAPTLLGVDLATGTVDWSASYPEFADLSLTGVAAGLILVTGDTDTEAILIALAP